MLGGADIGNNKVIQQQIKAFKLERPRQLKKVPQWNLAYVLQSMTRPPFEPLREASNKVMTYKTLVLLLLASAKRIGEVHAIDVTRIQWKEDGSEVHLYPVPGFMPKASAAAEGGHRFRPITIPALTNITGNDRHDPDRLLCPVRALKLYLKRTETFRGGRRNLFIHPDPQVKTLILKNALSAWARKTIILAYQSAPDEFRRLNSITTHEIRAIAASLNVHTTFKLEEVMHTCSWRSHTTFTNYYLRDVTTLVGDLRTLGPICAAGSLIA
jgi:integrase